ncbi:2OG-Fe(II) oxygenase [Tupanvirus deep ocean]|uniref:2OG-Fe(II) oxygenase n=2 Tax=Tupanvirus TaxID=2094720 RepID=A0AC62A8U7_9VIRU|nr:2OG-Fe(II) oxygenase [Tupanvirus deep ocean]QKU34196.1 2OG-Fe(II) oxygenase [Tupanvirus deep ocean]
MSEKTSKKTFTKYAYNLGDGAKVTHIPHYVTNPDALFEELHDNMPWNKYKYELHGKEVTSPRLMHIIKFDNDDNILDNLPEFAKIKKRTEKITGVNFKFAVLNYYRDGNDYIGFHPDREVKSGDIVVSVTVGAARRFVLKHRFRDNVKHVFILEHGDILILNEPAIKTAYKHSIPKMANVGPRINITFRQG